MVAMLCWILGSIFCWILGTVLCWNLDTDLYRFLVLVRCWILDSLVCESWSPGFAESWLPYSFTDFRYLCFAYLGCQALPNSRALPNTRWALSNPGRLAVINIRAHPAPTTRDPTAIISLMHMRPKRCSSEARDLQQWAVKQGKWSI